MDKIIIQGGTALQGRVVAAGAKNAALPILAATLLCQGDCRITNLPQVRDVGTMAMLLSLLGLSVKAEGSQALVNAMSVTSTEANSRIHIASLEALAIPPCFNMLTAPRYH